MYLVRHILFIFFLIQISYGLLLPESRITDGGDAEPGQFPYQVSIEFKFLLGKYKHICGGSIINENYILTAGQCTKGFWFKFGKMRVKAGKHYTKIDDEFVQISEVDNKIPHENCVVVGIFPQPYDIGLLKLKTPLVFNERVQPLQLPKQDDVAIGDAVLSGWGSISKKIWPKYPKVLQYAIAPIMDLNDCKAFYYRIRGPEVTDTMICSGPIGGSVSSCSYDIGGPFVQYVDGKAILRGIISWGMAPCGSSGAPSVYTKVSSYVDWINNKINN